MIDAGIPLVQALGVLAEQMENKSFKKVISAVRGDIEAGVSFYEALGKHPTVFSSLFISMARAGEASGTLHEILDRVAAYMEKISALKRKVKSSLVYPAVVISMAILITSFLLIKVVPTFKGIFEMLGGELPLPTQILIQCSNLLRNYLLFVIAGLLVFGFLIKKYISTDKGRYRFDAALLKIPIIGMLLRKVAIAQFSRTFSTLVRSGVAVLNALDIVGKSAGNKVIEEVVVNCRTAVRDGEPISRPLAKSGIFPPMVCRMISVGEQTGQLEKMLTKIADFYDDQVDAAVTGMTSMIEPLVIAFLGIVIGGIVVALFLPVLKITALVAR
jgi:type IV pilus assembly protein PilC